MNKKVVILGAGISGLTTAFLLHNKGYDVTVLEKKNEPGGSMESLIDNGYLFDKGPNSALETTPLIAEMVEQLKLTEEMIYSNKEANKRYILRGGRLHAMPSSPGKFLTTKLFSTSAKMRIFAEPFIGRSKDGYYQSIAEFVTRRFGREFLDYAINPFVAGVYAGNPEHLSVKSAFPKLYDLEEKYGGVIVGAIKSIRERKKRAEKAKSHAKMFTFKKGMQTLPNAIAKVLGDKIICSVEAAAIEQQASGGYNIKYRNVNRSGVIPNSAEPGKAGSPEDTTQDNTIELKSISCDILISTIPAYSAAPLFGRLDPEAGRHLKEIYYPPVLVMFTAYRKQSIRQPLDGFGFLIPSKEKRSYLGAIWSSTIFPGRVEDNDNAAFTLFVGGSRSPELFDLDRDILINKVSREFEKVMGINDKSVYRNYMYWPKAIPQYNIGYVEHDMYFDDFEKRFPGIILSGNYRGGISVGDCIKSAGKVTEQF